MQVSSTYLQRTIDDVGGMTRCPPCKKDTNYQRVFLGAFAISAAIAYMSLRVYNAAQADIQEVNDRRGSRRYYSYDFEPETTIGPYQIDSYKVAIATVLLTIYSAAVAVTALIGLGVLKYTQQNPKDKALHMLRSIKGIDDRLPTDKRIANDDQAELISEKFRYSQELLKQYSTDNGVGNHFFFRSLQELYKVERGQKGFTSSAQEVLTRYYELQTRLVDAQRSKLGLPIITPSSLELIA